VILDAMGAEKLLGSGDMLYTPPQSSQLKRVQCALVEDHELQALIDFVCAEAAPHFNQELVQTATGERNPESLGGDIGPDDPLFDDAVRVVLRTRRGSASLLQRALSVGYTRASRLIDLMTENGILGDHRGSKSREILLTLEDWEEQHGHKESLGVGDE
jgi:DNA segregation ATPase FtsK/SpoIIIE, S-DNA-T family